MTVPWDDPRRTRRIDYATREEIPPGRWRDGDWHDVTSMSDPDDCHVYVYTGAFSRTMPDTIKIINERLAQMIANGEGLEWLTVRKANEVVMIRVTFYEREVPFVSFVDEAGMASAYADWAQLCGYGITMEAV